MDVAHRLCVNGIGLFRDMEKSLFNLLLLGLCRFTRLEFARDLLFLLPSNVGLLRLRGALNAMK